MIAIQRQHSGVALLAFALLACGCEAPSKDKPLVLRCAPDDALPGFQNLDFLPSPYTSAAGENLSPPLQWTDGREATAQWALVFEDRDAAEGKQIRWIIYNLPAYLRELPAGIPPGIADLGREFFGARQGRNVHDETAVGYQGPAPVLGTGVHRYRFTLYALDSVLDIPAGATIEDLHAAISKHVLTSATLDCKYSETNAVTETFGEKQTDNPGAASALETNQSNPSDDAAADARGPGPPEPVDP